eukprot:10989561-Alexandrium_andersonii.AAC.1
MSARWKGGGLIAMPDSMTTPTVADIDRNAAWLFPIVAHYPHKVPSAFLLGDVLRALDAKWENRLLQPLEGTKEQLAL